MRTPQPNQSLSRWTLRRQDLIPTFMDALKVYAPTEYEAYVAAPFGPIPSYVYDEGDDSEWWDSEEAGWLLDELFNTLEGVAPEGCTFGAHEGDGSDFGFWMIEEDVEEEATTMNDYLVTWSIDVDSAYTAVEAAKEAAACQSDQTVGGMGKSTGMFAVTNKATGETVLVDLNEEE